jgi:hypothetical protein
MKMLMHRRGNRTLLAIAALLLVAGLSTLRLTSSAGGNAGEGRATIAKLFFLNIRGQVLSANPDGSDRRVLVDALATSPDGIAVDVAHGHIYWSNMGAANADDGSVMRANLDGSNVTTIVPAGGTFTAKQLKLDEVNRKLYWSDREGMRVQRANLDGTGLETLVEVATGDAARRDAANWCVGIAVDAERGHVYWTQKGGDNEGRGSIRRAGIDIPRGQTAANRTDIEVLFDALPEPIDLDLDLESRQIYWTDRGDAPRGNTVNRAPMDPPAGFDPKRRTDAMILASNFDETIGIALDLPRGMMYITDLRGSLYSTRLDGSDRKLLGSGLGSLTGIAFAEIPAAAPTTN